MSVGQRFFCPPDTVIWHVIHAFAFGARCVASVTGVIEFILEVPAQAASATSIVCSPAHKQLTWLCFISFAFSFFIALVLFSLHLLFDPHVDPARLK